MKLFVKKDSAQPKCTCGGNCGSAEASESDSAVKILGSGCCNCNRLEANTRQALQQLGMDDRIDHVTDFSKIAAYGVMSTPALVVDGKVLVYGKVCTVEELTELLRKARA